jgi:hypothetical protein
MNVKFWIRAYVSSKGEGSVLRPTITSLSDESSPANTVIPNTICITMFSFLSSLMTLMRTTSNVGQSPSSTYQGRQASQAHYIESTETWNKTEEIWNSLIRLPEGRQSKISPVPNSSCNYLLPSIQLHVIIICT